MFYCRHTLTPKISTLERCLLSKSWSPVPEICYKSGLEKIEQLMTSWQYSENEVLFWTQADLCPLFSPLSMDTSGKIAPTQEISCFLPFHSLYIISPVQMN